MARPTILCPMDQERLCMVLGGLPGTIRAFMKPRVYDVLFTTRRIVGVARGGVPSIAFLGGALVAAMVLRGEAEAQRRNPLPYDVNQLDQYLRADPNGFAVDYAAIRKARVYTSTLEYIVELKTTDKRKIGLVVSRKEEANAVRNLLSHFAGAAYSASQFM